MFKSTSRRLAIINVSLVALIVTGTVLLMYLALRTSLDREADRALDERIDVAARIWSVPLMARPPVPAVATPAVERAPDDDGEREEDSLHETLETGDTLIFAFAPDGALIGNERGIVSDVLPDRDAVATALQGKFDSLTITLDGDTLRVRTGPAIVDGKVVGVIQAARSDREHIAELDQVRTIGIAGIVMGLVVAFPTGFFLSRRAMAPISIAFERQREFVADASHELKTPLAVIRANVEIISREPDMPPDERAQEIRYVIAEIDDMTSMVNQLVDLAKIDRPPHVLATASTDVLDLIHDVTHEMQPLVTQSGLTITVSGEAHHLQTDAGLVRQVLRILLDNAVAYTERGDAIEIAVGHTAHAIRIKVSDTGIGISPEDQRHIFERFFRAERSRSRQSGGAGLGLSIAKGIVESLGGEILLTSSLGAGTVVTITLPSDGKA